MLVITNIFHGFSVRTNAEGHIASASVQYREVKAYDGEVLSDKVLDPQPISLDDAAKIDEIGAAINAAALMSISGKDAELAVATAMHAQERSMWNAEHNTVVAALAAERDAAHTSAATSKVDRDAFATQVQALQAQLAALTPSTAPLRFIKKWQLTAGMRKDDPSGAMLGAFTGVIANLPPAVKELWDGSSGVEEGSPFLSIAKGAPLHLTDAQIESMFDRYPKITQADILAMV